MYNTNDLVVPGNSYYLSYVRGIKTGWHSGAGYCLTTAAVQDTEYGYMEVSSIDNIEIGTDIITLNVFDEDE